MPKPTEPTETMKLPVEGFAILIQSAARAIIKHLELSSTLVDPSFLHSQVELLDELVGKFENLHGKEKENAPHSPTT